MILSDRAIRAAIQSGEIVIEPDVQQADIRSVGLRVHLGEDLLVPVESDEEIDLAYMSGGQYVNRKMGTQGYRIEKHSFLLACTREKVKTSRSIVCRIDGRSSIARNGLFVHCASSTIDNIHELARIVTLELYNCNRRPIRIRPGLPIAMLTFERLDGQILQGASRQYADQQKILGPRASTQLSD